MQQIKFSASDELFAFLEATAEKEEASLSETVRKYVEHGISFAAEPESQAQALMHAIPLLADLVKMQTGHEWWEHPLANRVMQDAVMFRIQRAVGVLGRSADFYRDAAPDPLELPPNRPVASNNPADWALAIEAIEYFDRRRKT